MELVTFSAVVTGTVCQHVEIVKEGLTKDVLVSGLKSGEYFTTIGESREIISLDGFEVVAKIIINEVFDDVEYSCFES